ncbi:MAG TPA: DUF4249 family protein [Crocinitomix sp.]|nr:DUF4249 family protein [Crocinitomix sp.]
MYKKNVVYLYSVLFLLAFSSCKTDFSVNGPYERIPIVMGLINTNDTTHYIKITRTFLGDGDNNVYANIPDSNYFDVVDAKIIELNTDNTPTGREWPLHDTIVTNKEDGLFYGPEQKVYVFNETNLDGTKKLKLVADLDEGKYKIDAITNLTSGFLYNSQYSIPGFTLGFAYGESSQNNEYPNARITYTQALNGKLYLTSIVFRWRETYTDLSTKEFSIKLDDNEVLEQKNSQAPENTDGIGKETPSFSGDELYKFIKEKIKPDANVVKREFVGIDFVTTISNQELATYMEISKPQSSIAETKPNYTNINSSNGKALGIFACRQYVWHTNLSLNANSIKELCIGQYTNDLGFCSSLPVHASEPFFCN